ncbi:MAG TPA: TRAP transporter TatT component family protein [Bacteroidota bacterium]|nr:TRAP transporter TatT component family protein [Bacteroidota bacterium]
MRLPILLAFLSIFAFAGCIRTIAVSTVGGIADDGFEAFTSESDLAFAEQALPGNLKLLEVMLKSDPDNERLLRLLSQGYSSYALGFLEGTDDVRARDFYLRGRDFGYRILRRDARLARALDGTVDELKAELATRGKDDVPGVFWSAFGLGSYIQLSLTEPSALADLPKAEAMMEFVERADSTYYYGGADLFLGTLAGMRPKMLGGNPERAKAYFDKAVRISGGKFLITYDYEATAYAVPTQNEELFSELLGKVRDASLEILPEFRLANAIAKKKAEMLLAKKSDLF